MLPERAFQSLGGKMTLEGGGDQPAPAQPTTATQYNTNIPEYAKPYVTNMLGATQQQLFNMDSSGAISGFKPYQPYSSNVNDYFAGFSPMQTQAQQATANMQVPGQYNVATGIAGAAGMGSLGAGQQYNQMATNPYATQAFMSPYQQNVTDWQKQQAVMDYGRALPGMGAAASNKGAFGGSRQAIVEGEGQRNLQNTLAGIQATGSQNAFQNAQQAQQFGANLGMTGYNQALQGASTLANIGGQELGAQQGIASAQNAMGAQQQALEQSKINQGIQNYATQQQYPMMQLGMMSNMLRGLPMQSTTTQTYQAAPSTASQVVGSAGALASAYKGLTSKEGGVIKGLAHGGSIDGQGYAIGGEIKQQLSMMSDDQLQQIIRTSASNEIRAMAAEILATHRMAEQMTNRPEAGIGQAGQTGQTEQGLMAANTGDTFTSMADGGIIAFAPGGYTDDELAANRAKLREEEKAPVLTDAELAERMAQPVIPGLPAPTKAEVRNIQPGPNASIEDYATYLGNIRTNAGIGKPREAEREMLDKRMAARDSQETSQNYFKAAEFFAKMANTPGGLLRSATEAGAEVLPGFAKLREDQLKIREKDAQIMADINEANRLDKLGLFDQAAKLRGEAQKLQGENARSKDEIAGREKVAGITGQFGLEGHKLDAASREKVANIQAGMPSDAKSKQAIYNSYVKAVKAEHPTWTSEKVEVEANRLMQADSGFALGRVAAAGDEAEAKRFQNYANGKEGINLRTYQRERRGIETIPPEKRTPQQVQQLENFIALEEQELASLREMAKKVPRAAAPSAAPIPTAPPPGSVTRIN